MASTPSDAGDSPEGSTEGVPDLASVIGPELAGALAKRGYTTLTLVQQAVLEPELADRDLRISSQTGSGKTVAVGLAMRELVQGEAEPTAKAARPRALVIAPTRELAKQFEDELKWLYAPLGIKIASVTGGPSYRDELRAFKRGPAVVVGTPGRLLDHLTRGAIDASNVAAVVLDEADRMLDLGFREDLEKILAGTPEGRRTHLVSATFPREVLALADRVQDDPARVEGTPLGAANTDIEHVIHLVHPKERGAAIVNLLLAHPGAQTLVFARTRADVAELAGALDDAGFNVGMLSGEMEQPERNRALSAFKRGTLAALVATDVAARGIDVVDIARVIHAEPPSDADAYTHRSGRTGRAGRKGTSSVLVAPGELIKTVRLLARARVQHRFERVPTAESIRAAQDERLFAELTADATPVSGSRGSAEGGTRDASDMNAKGPPDARALALAERLVGSSDPTRVVARLVAQVTTRGLAEPRPLTPIDPPARARFPQQGHAQESRPGRGPAPRGEHRGEPRGEHRGEHRGQPSRPVRDPSESSPKRNTGDWVTFRVSWGEIHGADTRRMVAMLCRRGQIEGRDIGAIRVSRTSSVVEIAKAVAQAFEETTRAPDPRDPRVQIRRWIDEGENIRPPKLHRAPGGPTGGGARPKRPPQRH